LWCEFDRPRVEHHKVRHILVSGVDIVHNSESLISLCSQRTCKNVYHFREQKQILEMPGAFNSFTSILVICCFVYLRCRFSETEMHLFNLNMRLWTVNDRSLSQKIGKKKMVSADALNWLQISQLICKCQHPMQLTLISRSPKVNPFFIACSRHEIGAKLLARASSPFSYACQLGNLFKAIVILCSIASYPAPYSSYTKNWFIWNWHCQRLKSDISS
jgi:hypothetical protein